MQKLGGLAHLEIDEEFDGGCAGQCMEGCGGKTVPVPNSFQIC
jgi:hypothetical protein